MTRSEAIKRGSRVTLCPSGALVVRPAIMNRVGSCSPDVDSNAALDAGEAVIRVFEKNAGWNDSEGK
ncbi:MAG: GspH/FimT family protein [Candidatus Competibacteraceae bacterium]|nr:GspH/FimT family protein [Candidatus Competibacteraceae bacterium]